MTAKRSRSLFLPASCKGIAGGITLPIAQSMLLNEYPKRLKAVALTVWGLFSITPFTIGMPVGGYIAYMLGWRFLFYLDFVLTLVIVGTLAALLYGARFRRRYARFDLVGFVLLAGVAAGASDVAQHGQRFRLAGFALPPSHRRGAARWRFPVSSSGNSGSDIRRWIFDCSCTAILSSASSCLTLGFFSIQGLLSLLIVQIQLILGYSSKLAGLALLPLVLLGAPAIAVMHILCKYIDARWLICLNSLGFAWTFYWIGLFDDPHRYEELFWPMVVEGIFLGSFFTPVTVLTLHGLSGPLVMRAAEVANLLRVAAGAFGITFQGIVLFRRIHFHQLHLADHFGGRQSISYRSDGAVDGQTQRGGIVAVSDPGQAWLLIRQEAAILGLNDAFLVASVLFWHWASSCGSLIRPTYRWRRLRRKSCGRCALKN